jgi:ABC-type branched-subunit amino acid transport system substrate-binding protein
MKNRRLSIVSVLIVAILIVTTLFTFGCTGETPPETQTLKIGVVAWLGYAPGLDMVRTLDVAVDVMNENGGLAVGNDEYTIELISYDTQATQSVEVSAVNRLVFEDEVDFILCDPWFASGWLSTTEDNEVLVLFHNPFSDLHDPAYHYAFGPTFISSETAVTVGWFFSTYPDYESYVLTTEDSMTGHMVAGEIEHFFEIFGKNVTSLFYPEAATDLSAIGTQIVQINPDVYIDSSAQGLGYKAAKQAGYEGQLFSIVSRTIEDLKNVLSDEDLEGFIGAASPTEFTPPLVTEGVDFMADYTAEYGTWDNPYLHPILMFDCLLTAIEQTGSLDVDEIAEVIGNGLEWDTVLGPAKMVARADMENTRTTSAVGTTYIKQIEGGQVELLATVGLDEAESYFEVVYTAPGPSTECPPAESVITWEEAKNFGHCEVTVTVTGIVDSTMSIMPPETLILLGGPIMDGFPVTIPDDSTFPAGLIDSYVGETIEVTGELTTNPFGDATIMVTDPSQIVIQ